MKLLQSGQLPLLTISSLEHILQKVWPQGIKAEALCLTMQTQQVCSMEPTPSPSSSPSSSASSSNSSSSLNIYLDPSSPISLSVSSNKSISDIITGACACSASASASCAAASDASCAATASLADSALPSPGFSPSSSPSSSSKLSRKVTTRPRLYGSDCRLAEFRIESCGRRVPAVLFSEASPAKRVEPRRLNWERIAGAPVAGEPESSVAGVRSSTW